MLLMVPGAGIEPARVLPHWCLRPTRLPIPPSGLPLYLLSVPLTVLFTCIRDGGEKEEVGPIGFEPMTLCL